MKQLEAAIREYIQVHNEDPKPFVWTRTADQILDSIARFAQRTRAGFEPMRPIPKTHIESWTVAVAR